MPERLFTTEQVARLLGVSPGAVAQWVEKGWLEAQHLPGNALRVAERALLKFLRNEGVDIEEIMARIVREQPGQEAELVAAGAPHRAAANAQAAPDASAGARAAEPSAPPPAETAAVDADEEVDLGGLVSDMRHFAGSDVPPAGSPTPVAVPRQIPEAPPAPAAEQAAGGAAPEPDAAEPEAEAAAPPSPPERPEPSPAPKRAKRARRKRRARKPASRKAAPEARALKADAVPQLAGAVVADALARGARAVHLQPSEKGLSLRLRINGRLHEKAAFRRRVAPELARQLVEHFRHLAGDDGRFRMTADGRQVSLAFSACPTSAGERVVLRVLGRTEQPEALADVGLSGADEAVVRPALERAGLVLVAAPPRHGGIDALHAMLTEVAAPGRNVLSVERSADADRPGVGRCEFDPVGGRTYARVMRAFAGQDADAILVEDVRDPTTAHGAVESAAGGATVLAGIRAADAAAAVAMLLEMGVEGWTLASALRVVVERRLVGRLCDECKQRRRPAAAALRKLGVDRASVGAWVYAPRGCAKCARTGYAGTIALHAAVPIEGELARLIRSESEEASIRAAAGGAGSVRRAALESLAAGETSAAEFARAFPVG